MVPQFRSEGSRHESTSLQFHFHHRNVELIVVIKKLDDARKLSEVPPLKIVPFNAISTQLEFHRQKNAKLIEAKKRKTVNRMLSLVLLFGSVVFSIHQITSLKFQYYDRRVDLIVGLEILAVIRMFSVVPPSKLVVRNPMCT